MLGLKQVGAGMMETGRGSEAHSTGMDRQKQSGLWVVGFGLEGWPKSPRQDEAAAVVRLVWPAGCRAVRVVALLAHGPLEISRK